MSGLRQTPDELHAAGDPADAGSFVCIDCSLPISLDHSEPMPRCPACGGDRFKRGSLFEQPTLSQVAIQAPRKAPEGWLADVRDSLETSEPHLAFYADGHAKAIELPAGWSRVGRSARAEIRLDDPTVSRRHAVIVRNDEDELSALDDRSLNGILLNGEPIDWSPLADGDRLAVGRYTLHVIDPGGADPAQA